MLTGDMISRSVRDMSGIDNLTRSLSDLCPVYACPGNHELDLPSEIYEKYKTIMQKNGVIYLENRRTVFERNGVKINIAGASLRKASIGTTRADIKDFTNIPPKSLRRI